MAIDGGMLECQDGLCVNPSCPLGKLGCFCAAGKSCADESLNCSEDNKCVDASCPAGSEGCACQPDEACGRAEDETPLTCVASVCRNCRAEDCGTPGLTVPTSPACFSPCRAGFTDHAAKYHACGADGLMRHEPDQACLDGRVCRFGSCLNADDKLPSCNGDVGCPDFQNCVDGRCYSVCDANADCPTALACYRHACRKPCTSSDQTCPEHTACTLTDSKSGYCMPVGPPPTGVQEGPVLGTFEVSTESIAFNSANVNATFTITNNGPIADRFIVTKLEQTEPASTMTPPPPPMPWLKIGEPGQEALQPSAPIVVEAGTSRTFSLIGANTDAFPRWQGALEVKSDRVRLGARRIDLSYAGSVDGRWVGSILTFANFGTRNLDAWIADKSNISKLNVVGNALVARWGVFRRGNIPRANFDAALQSAAKESWLWPTVQAVCPAGATCYPYIDSENPLSGIERFSSDATGVPVPTGVSELPVALNLMTKASDARWLEGRIETSQALQYPGDPAITLQLASDPTAAKCALSNAGECIVPVSSLKAIIAVGGRYAISQFGNDTACPSEFLAKNTPWLVPGFLQGTTTDPKTGVYHHSECRNALQPGAGNADLNAALSAANPVPDGKTRERTLELVDGVMVDQETLYLIVKEHFESILGAGDTTEFAAYGVLTLRRAPANLDLKSYVGSTPPTSQAPPDDAVPAMACDPGLLTRLRVTGGVTQDNAVDIATALLSGLAVASLLPKDPLLHEQVHYLCHDTGRIDGGDTLSNGGANSECPAGSNVTYFYFTNLGGLTESQVNAEISALPCQDDGTCQSVLDTWRAADKWGIASKAPVYRCTDFEDNPEAVFCDTNRGDLRAGKVFYPTDASSTIVFSPLRTTVNEAFRYKTAFRTRDNRTVGFAPAQCVPDSDAVPYCYDAPQIEEARQRVDCAIHLYRSYPSLRATGLAPLGAYLGVNFAFEQNINPPLYTYDGFETMYSELLVMLGDDAYTAAFASRFDLAGANKVSFQGSRFEPGGIDLSGAAGFELYRLYQASQYYSLVLDRFYRLIPALTTATGTFESFITKDTFGSYFPKLVRASVQRTRVASEIAKRYQSFNRPDLARQVIKQGYTSAYLESIVIGALVTRYVDQSGTEKAYVEKVRRDAALTYKAALYDMRDAFQRITDDERHFGFAPDFVPFPALDPGDINAFTKLLGLARQRAAMAAQNEQTALSSNRSYEVDSASFQAELVKLRINYDNQLADICGTFKGRDGAVYPAISRYAYRSDEATAYGDPCGFMGTGRLYGAMSQLEINRLEFRGIEQQYQTVLDEIESERTRVEAQCKLIGVRAQASYKAAGKARSLQDAINDTQARRSAIAFQIQTLDRIATAMDCIFIVGPGANGTNCLAKAAARVFILNATAPLQFQDLVLQDRISGLESEISNIQNSHALWDNLQQCNVAKIDSEALIEQKWLGLKGLEIESLKADYRVRLAFSEIHGLRNQAERIEAEAEEIEAQTISIEAARNDPNVRIYKNDAIISAERTFDAAMAAAYQATKVYEYYTSQTYGRSDQLFLIRMIEHGDYNLENYLLQLEDAYLAFQQSFGNPDDRVELLSLRDDIFAIPRIDKGGRSVSQSDRIAEFRTKLKDVALLDERGYLTVPFATVITRLSPLTRNHKLKRIEVEIIGSDVGDAVGRVYLRQKGTGLVQGLNDKPIYYRFPELTAVLDPFFNGVRSFGPEIYLSDRLRDRPLVNSRWDLVLNQRDETVNGDIDLGSLTDIRLYLYYTDFTAL
ncbi:MAG TPA: hypothetical protein VG937_10440 [Polyangiaceae bacterium]|nr:hypothetical protein [Polyangiaceae bacterium]